MAQSIAEEIKSFYIISENKDHDGLMFECELKALYIEEDFAKKTTTFKFMDGSSIIACNGEYTTHL